MRTFRRRIKEAFWPILAAGIILTVGWVFGSSVNAERAYTNTNLLMDGATSHLIRLHVVANSDDLADQEIKLLVRDRIFQEFGALMEEAEGVVQAKAGLFEHLDDIGAAALGCLEEVGAVYGASVTLGKDQFPDKGYTLKDGSSLFLPRGTYDALKVVLGEGKGENWWCVMYPPLCYFDVVQKTDCADDNACFLLIDESETKDVPVQIRFFVVDTVKDGLKKLRNVLQSIKDLPR